MVVRRARGHGHRTVDGLDDVGHCDGLRRAAQPVAAAGALHRHQQPRAHQPLQHLGEQLQRNLVGLGNFARARRAPASCRRPGAASPSARNRPFSRASACSSLNPTVWSYFTSSRPWPLILRLARIHLVDPAQDAAGQVAHVLEPAGRRNPAALALRAPDLHWQTMAAFWSSSS